MDDSLDGEMNAVDVASGFDENMNNEEYAKGTGVRKKDETPTKKRKFYQRYLYQQDYHEALRSLLWEPYDCRNTHDDNSNNNNNNVNDEDEESDENWCLLANKVPKRKLSSSEASTVSSCSSDAGAGASAFDKRISWPLMRCTTSSRSGRPQSSGACDLDREQMDIMVSDLRRGGNYGGRGDSLCQQGALVSDSHQGIRQCVRDRAQGVSCAMAASVSGTLEPPDASDSTQLVESSSLSLSSAAAPTSSANVSVVNCYRAVPVAVVSSVPTIKCLNTQDNISNVNVVNVRAGRTPPALPGASKLRTKRPVPIAHLTNHNRSVSNPVLGQHPRPSTGRYGSHQNLPIRLETHFGDAGLEQSQTFVTNQNVIPPTELQPKPRTFTSTEAQTDDIGVPLNVPLRSLANREQRRRERRERRHQRRLHQSVIEGSAVWQTNVEALSGEIRGLPDLLHSHLPPPYIPGAPVLPPPLPSVHVPAAIPVAPPSLPHLVDPALNPPPHPPGVGFAFPFSGSSRRSRLSSRNTGYVHEEETPKACCGMVVTQAVSIRWFIIMIAFVGFCCVTVGTVLGAMKASGREHLTVSLLMIGVGIVLVTVSVVAWRLTSQDAPSCRSMLGLGSAEDSATEPNRRFVPRMPPSYGRPHHPYAAMMYPEFQYRPPPPSYQASMQEYRLRLLLLERPGNVPGGVQGAISPPPVYRSHAGSNLGLRSLPQSEYSHPPSYRSRTSSTRPSLDPSGGSVVHSRDPSLISHVSDGNGTVAHAVVNVISVLGNTVELHQTETDLQIDGLKLCVDSDVPIPPLRMLLAGKGGKQSSQQGHQRDDTKSDNLNLVTIVTVSDATPMPSTREHSVDSDVLAHL